MIIASGDAGKSIPSNVYITPSLAQRRSEMSETSAPRDVVDAKTDPSRAPRAGG